MRGSVDLFFYPNLGDDRKEDGIDDGSSSDGRKSSSNNVNLEQRSIITKEEETKSIPFSSKNKDGGVRTRKFPYLNQMTVNEYKPGQGILFQLFCTYKRCHCYDFSTLDRVC